MVVFFSVVRRGEGESSEGYLFISLFILLLVVVCFGGKVGSVV